MKLLDKVAIISGGGGGIGRAISLRYAQEGARCAVADINGDAAASTVEAITQAGGSAFPVALDVTSERDIARLVETVVETAGRIDILVNNAAIFDMQPLLEVTRDSWDRTFAINTKGLFFTLQAVAQRMVDQGEGGKIIAGRSRKSLRLDRPHKP